jgi:integrase
LRSCGLFRCVEAWREVTATHERETQSIVRFVFHRGGRQVKSIRGTWESACKKAGCPDLLFHHHRRSAARNLIRAGVPETVAMRITGHRTRSMLDRYNITADGPEERC